MTQLSKPETAYKDCELLTYELTETFVSVVPIEIELVAVKDREEAREQKQRDIALKYNTYLLGNRK